jgi:hypothetical protein
MKRQNKKLKQKKLTKKQKKELNAWIDERYKNGDSTLDILREVLK